MSMIFELRQVSQEVLDGLYTDPSDILFFLYGSEPYTPPPSFFSKLFSKNKSNSVKREWVPPEKEKLLDLEQAWHLLHFLFCRDPDTGKLPQATLLAGGREIGNIDVGYGPARGLSQEEVGAFLSYLDSIDSDTFGKDVTTEDLDKNEIYGHSGEWLPEYLDDVWEYIDDLKKFFFKAKNENNAVILYLY